jgi:hypothetical protein
MSASVGQALNLQNLEKKTSESDNNNEIPKKLNDWSSSISL